MFELLLFIVLIIIAIVGFIQRGGRPAPRMTQADWDRQDAEDVLAMMGLDHVLHRRPQGQPLDYRNRPDWDRQDAEDVLHTMGLDHVLRPEPYPLLLDFHNPPDIDHPDEQSVDESESESPWDDSGPQDSYWE